MLRDGLHGGGQAAPLGALECILFEQMERAIVIGAELSQFGAQRPSAIGTSSGVGTAYITILHGVRTRAYGVRDERTRAPVLAGAPFCRVPVPVGSYAGNAGTILQVWAEEVPPRRCVTAAPGRCCLFRVNRSPDTQDGRGVRRAARERATP